jgi:ubiquinone/menaquinone biosynthesis C-methylase UbiE
MERHDPSNAEISRVLRSRDEARASYNRLSQRYDVLAGSEQHFAERGIDQLAPAPGERILEIGYGTGAALARIAVLVGEAGRAYGIDISEGMRAVAQRRIQRAGLSSRIRLVTGDACMLPFGPASMDAIFMSFTLELFDIPEIPVVLHQCRRLLTSHGRICVVSLAAEQHPGMAVRLYEWMHRRFPKVVDCRPILVKQSLEEAGFCVQSVSRHVTWGLPLDICLATKVFSAIPARAVGSGEKSSYDQVD